MYIRLWLFNSHTISTGFSLHLYYIRHCVLLYFIDICLLFEHPVSSGPLFSLSVRCFGFLFRPGVFWQLSLASPVEGARCLVPCPGLLQSWCAKGCVGERFGAPEEATLIGLVQASRGLRGGGYITVSRVSTRPGDPPRSRRPERPSGAPVAGYVAKLEEDDLGPLPSSPSAQIFDQCGRSFGSVGKLPVIVYQNPPY